MYENIGEESTDRSAGSGTAAQPNWSQIGADMLLDREILPLLKQKMQTWDKNSDGYLSLDEIDQSARQTNDAKERQLATFLHNNYADLAHSSDSFFSWFATKQISIADIEKFESRNERFYNGCSQTEAPYVHPVGGQALANPVEEQIARDAARAMNSGLEEGNYHFGGANLDNARLVVFDLMKKIGQFPFQAQMDILNRIEAINRVGFDQRTAPGLSVQFGDSRGDGNPDYIAKISLKKYASEDDKRSRVDVVDVYAQKPVHHD